MAEKQTKNINFEEAIAELNEIVQKLENGNQSLEVAMELYKRGNFLTKYCDKMLGEAKLKVEKLIKSSDGKITTTEFDIEN